MRKHSPERRILVADDSRDMARRIAETLAELDQVTVVGPAHDGLEALALYEAEPPDAVILDFDMPGLSGLEVLRRIRSGGGDCLVVMLTAHSGASVRERCLAEGADHFLQKGVDEDRLIEIIGTRL